MTKDQIRADCRGWNSILDVPIPRLILS